MAAGFSCPVACGVVGDRTCVPCIGRWILNHWTREVPEVFILFFKTTYLLNFWLCWVFVAAWAFSRHGVWASCCRGVSCGRVWVRGERALVVVLTRGHTAVALELGFRSRDVRLAACSMWDLPRPGMEPA